MLCSKCGYYYYKGIVHVCPPSGVTGITGYSCQLCQVWVPNGVTHVCNGPYKVGPTWNQFEEMNKQLKRIADALEELQKDEMGALKVRVK